VLLLLLNNIKQDNCNISLQNKKEYLKHNIIIVFLFCSTTVKTTIYFVAVLFFAFSLNRFKISFKKNTGSQVPYVVFPNAHYKQPKLRADENGAVFSANRSTENTKS